MLLEAFRKIAEDWENGAGRWDVLEDIITLRASFLIDRALTGMSIDFDRALGILRAHNDFVTDQERRQRDIIVAAIDNLVDFAAAEECSMVDDLPSDLDIEDIELYEQTFERFNGAGASQENEDVLYAGAMAAWWLMVSVETMITFMTMGDERVRPWHEAYEGFSYRKSEFPQELIPPIEWGCRCFLTADGFASVTGQLPSDRVKIKTNPIFRESLAMGGRIFSDQHPYFKVNIPAPVRSVVEKIKEKFFLR